jgi:hypothetical protein
MYVECAGDCGRAPPGSHAVAGGELGSGLRRTRNSYVQIVDCLGRSARNNADVGRMQLESGGARPGIRDIRFQVCSIRKRGSNPWAPDLPALDDFDPADRREAVLENVAVYPSAIWGRLVEESPLFLDGSDTAVPGN